ncbi:MAG: hypothetical protein ACQESZ_00230 [Bacteroidota bacterium]
MIKENLNYFSRNKIIPEDIVRAALKALSFYPELVNIKIEFRFSENIRKSVMQAQPLYITMYKPRKKRSYLIKISRYFFLKGKKMHLHDLPEDVLVGWLGHELGHIMDYKRRDAWSMILFGIGYITSKSFIMSAERFADTYAVNHGLGDYILATKNFILHQAGMPKEYIRKINKLYLPPEEIIEMIEEKELL